MKAGKWPYLLRREDPVEEGKELGWDRDRADATLGTLAESGVAGVDKGE